MSRLPQTSGGPWGRNVVSLRIFLIFKLVLMTIAYFFIKPMSESGAKMSLTLSSTMHCSNELILVCRGRI